MANGVREAITKSTLAEYDSNELNGTGVLDPSCGSGTFLYFSTLRILQSEAMERQAIPLRKQASVVARLVNGIDVHPVAAEMARATLMRALRWDPGKGIQSLRIYEGDSLQIRNYEDSLFTPGEEQYTYESPRGVRVHLPQSFVRRQDFAESVRRLVHTAVDSNPCPEDIVFSCSA